MNGSEESARRSRLLRLVTAASVTTAAVLIAVKLVVWLITDSVSLLASLVDSIMDAAASLINLLAVRVALTPPDAEHRFGHGKAESLAGLGQATFIAGSAVFLALQGVERLINPQPIQHGALGVAVMVFSIVATAGLLFFQRYVIRHTSSNAISADALHYASDLAANLAIILALVLAGFGISWADPVFALGLAAYILKAAYDIGRRSLDELLDRELPDETRNQILALIMAQPGVLGAHQLRTRQSGYDWFIQVHLDMDAEQRLSDAHEIGNAVERAILNEYPRAEVIVHHDPVVKTPFV